MKKFFNHLQLVFVSVALLVVFCFTMLIVLKYNRRLDLTPNKLYSLSSETTDLLRRMIGQKVEVIAFYPSQDAQREDFEIFLKQCQLKHPQFNYYFYNPNSRPQLANFWKIKELYTVIIRYQDRQERIVLPNEEEFSSALLRLLEPRKIPVCFMGEPGRDSLESDRQEGYLLFRDFLKDQNYSVIQQDLNNNKITSTCDVLVIAGPESDWSQDELDQIKKGLSNKYSVLFLIDPMEPGTGQTFVNFLKNYGVTLGEDVIVDKMSRMVGGDFLLPFINQYYGEHEITKFFNEPSFFPVARSVDVEGSLDDQINRHIIGFTGSNSWAEHNLEALERGEATFDPDVDYPGPVPLIAALELKQSESTERGSRMVVVGDSDFITNAYIHLSGNQQLAAKIIRWLARDDRYVVIEREHSTFQPLMLEDNKRFMMLLITLVLIPAFFLFVGFLQYMIRKRAQ